MEWTPSRLVKWISEDLELRGFPKPYRFQAEQLVSHALNLSRLDIYLQYDRPCTQSEQDCVRKLLKRRYRREPTAYILGTCDFWTLTLEVGPGVLIPRIETEILIETTIEKIPVQTHSTIRLLELGTGSGVIPLSLCSERNHLQIFSTEISKEALHYAKRNLDRYRDLLEPKHNSVFLIQSDKFEAINTNLKFDIIVGNPPYIAEDLISSLQPEVRDWEPKLALMGGKSGIEFYRYLFHFADNYLSPGGYLILEHGYDQRDLLVNLLHSVPTLKFEHTRKDYSGHDRVLTVQKPLGSVPD